MASCEKCWADAQGNYIRYHELIEEREENQCTPEEQAGKDAKTCPKCNRATMHIIINKCIICGYDNKIK